MNYKRVFLDANIILDIYDATRPFYKESSTAVSILLQNGSELFTSCDIITTLYYLLAKKDKLEALDSILDINELCTIIEFGNQEIEQSCILMKQNKNFIPNFALEGASDVLVLGSRGVEEKRRRTRRVR